MNMWVIDKFQDETQEQASASIDTKKIRANWRTHVKYLQAWQYEYFWSCYTFDLTNLSVGILLNLVATIQVKKNAESLLHDAPIMLLTMVFAQQACLFSLLVWHRPWYTRWRTQLALSFFLSRVIVTYFAIGERSVLGVLPLEWPSGAIKSTLHVLFVPLFIGRHCLSFLLPERAATILCLSHLVSMLFNNFSRCSLELAKVPRQGKRYFDIISTVQVLFMKWFPLPLPFGMDVSSINLSEQGACLAFKATLQIAIGYFVPMAVLLAEESVSRKRFRIRRGYSETYTYPASILILQYMFLIPFQAVVTFNAVVLLLQWSGF